MDPSVIALIGILILLALLAARVPVAFALALAGAAGLFLMTGQNITQQTLGTAPFASVSTITLAVIPMFILMGMLAEEAGVPRGLFRVASRWLKKLPGGLAVATVAAGAGFGAVTGSSVASAATIGRLSIGEMRAHGYKKEFAAGTVAMAGTLGVLIPPSVILVLYGVVTGESVGRLLMGGIVPGVVSALLFAGVVIVRSVFTPRAVFNAPVEGESGKPEMAKPALHDYRHLLWIAIVFALVVGGVYTGRFTATESGAIGALVLMLLLLVEKRRTGVRGLTSSMASVSKRTASTTAMMLAIVIGASIFSTMLSRTGVTQRLTSTLAGFDISPMLLALAFVVLLVALGTFLETISLMLIAIPLMYPVMSQVGVDGIWFGVMAAKAVEIGLVTPPVGMNAYVVAGTSKSLRVEDVFKGIVPFYVAEVLVITLLFAFPELITWLPSMMD